MWRNSDMWQILHFLLYHTGLCITATSGSQKLCGSGIIWEVATLKKKNKCWICFEDSTESLLSGHV